MQSLVAYLRQAAEAQMEGVKKFLDVRVYEQLPGARQDLPCCAQYWCGALGLTPDTVTAGVWRATLERYQRAYQLIGQVPTWLCIDLASTGVTVTVIDTTCRNASWRRTLYVSGNIDETVFGDADMILITVR